MEGLSPMGQPSAVKDNVDAVLYLMARDGNW
jgi:hypothetical protein